ncbi:MAG: hypothetical protein AAF518_25725, partial [Spirochaetota bacterium]
MNVPTLVCSEESLAYFGNDKFEETNRCPNQPQSDLSATKNPTCKLSTYRGGLKCCRHKQSLLDSNQTKHPIYKNNQYLEFQLKFRFYYQQLQYDYDKKIDEQENQGQQVEEENTTNQGKQHVDNNTDDILERSTLTTTTASTTEEEVTYDENEDDTTFYLRGGSSGSGGVGGGGSGRDDKRKADDKSKSKNLLQKDRNRNNNYTARKNLQANIGHRRRPSHQNLIRLIWETDNNSGEYDIVQCPPGTPPSQCV